MFEKKPFRTNLLFLGKFSFSLTKCLRYEANLSKKYSENPFPSENSSHHFIGIFNKN